MGQYYRIVNVDRRQQLVPYDFDNGAKLMEWSYNRNHRVLALMNLLAGPWKGERVYVVGDYADLSDPAEPCHEPLKKVLRELCTEDLYSYAADHYTQICDTFSGRSDRGNETYQLIPDITKDEGYRYIYNHATKQVIDLEKCPIEWTWYDASHDKAFVTKVAPLPLLLAMGNGRGGGDYHDAFEGYMLVGSWCDSSQYISVTSQPLADTEDYEEFAPDFTEQRPAIPWNEEAYEIEKCEKAGRKAGA